MYRKYIFYTSLICLVTVCHIEGLPDPGQQDYGGLNEHFAVIKPGVRNDFAEDSQRPDSEEDEEWPVSIENGAGGGVRPAPPPPPPKRPTVPQPPPPPPPPPSRPPPTGPPRPPPSPPPRPPPSPPPRPPPSQPPPAKYKPPPPPTFKPRPPVARPTPDVAEPAEPPPEDPDVIVSDGLVFQVPFPVLTNSRIHEFGPWSPDLFHLHAQPKQIAGLPYESWAESPLSTAPKDTE